MRPFSYTISLPSDRSSPLFKAVNKLEENIPPLQEQLYDEALKTYDQPKLPLVFLAFYYNLSEFIKNAYDAEATKITINLRQEGENQILCIEDDGQGFSSGLLPDTQTTCDYRKIVGERASIRSDKHDDPQQTGGSGRGLVQTLELLEAYEGGITLTR